MSLWTSLEPASTTVDAGSTATVRLRIRNTGDVVDEYRFTMVGDLAPYITVEPPTLRLYPGTTGTVELTVAPPRTPDAAAGPHPYAVQVTPTEHPEATTVPEGNITVTPFMEVRAELVPHTVKGRFRGRPKLAVDNLGNTTLTASVTGDDNGDQIGYEIVPANVQIEPGRAAFLNATLRPRQIIWFGQKQNRPYRLVVRRSGVTPLNVDGTYVQRGFLPRWLFTVLSLCVGLVIAFVALWMTNPPAFSSEATPLVVAPSSSELPTPSLSAAPPPTQAPPPTPQQAPTTAPQQVPPTNNGSGGGSGGSSGGGGGNPAPTTSAPGGGGVELVGRGSNKCLTVSNGASWHGQGVRPLELDDCSNAAWQQWAFVGFQPPDYRGTIQSEGRCLDPRNASSSDGTTLQVEPCTGGSQQVWTLNTTAQGDLVNIAFTKCGEALNNGTSNGTPVQLFTCNGQPDQKWVQTQG